MLLFILLSDLPDWLDEQLGTPESWLTQTLPTVVNLWYDLYDQVADPYEMAIQTLKTKEGFSDSARHELHKAIKAGQNKATGFLYAAYGDRQLFLIDQILVPQLAKLDDEDGEYIGERLSFYMQHPCPQTDTLIMAQSCQQIWEEYS